MPGRVARFLATVRPALPFPFLSPLSFPRSLFLCYYFTPLLFYCHSLSISLSLSLSFPFLFVLSSSRRRRRRRPWPWRSARTQERNTSSCRSSHTFHDVPHVAGHFRLSRDAESAWASSRAFRLIIPRDGGGPPLGSSLIKGCRVRHRDRRARRETYVYARRCYRASTHAHTL